MTSYHDVQVLELYEESTLLAAKSENYTTAPQHLDILLTNSVVADVQLKWCIVR